MPKVFSISRRLYCIYMYCDVLCASLLKLLIVYFKELYIQKKTLHTFFRVFLLILSRVALEESVQFSVQVSNFSMSLFAIPLELLI